MGLFKKKAFQVYSCVEGEVIPLEQIPDPMFSSRALGDGVAVIPSVDKILAPVDCRIRFIFPTFHAIGLICDQGIEILIHIGIDTVNLQGKGFKPCVKENQVVKKGDVLMEIDLEWIKTQVISTAVIMIFTNLDNKQTITCLQSNEIDNSKPLLEIRT